MKIKVKIQVISVNIILLFLFLFGSLRSYCRASNEFTTSYDISYNFNDSGIAHVNYLIKIINLTSDFYVSKYAITLGSNINNIKMYDSSGELKTTITSFENSTKIETEVKDKIGGLNKTLNLRLDFDSTELAKKNGQVWEITLPGIMKQDGVSDYNIKLLVPESFGRLLYTSPEPIEYLHWTKTSLNDSGINAYFGELQVFDFNLDYHLINTEKNSVKETIALPLDTNYQKILLYSLEPKPINIYRDVDGNWLADYVLKPSEKLLVNATGSAEVYWQPRNDFKERVGNLEIYMRKQRFWETTDPEIMSLAKKLTTPKEIYDYVVSSLDYDYNRAIKSPVRYGAKKALSNKNQAICMEYTDLFITLSRAAKIPAREVDGYAYTLNPKLFEVEQYTDVLHTWPEYYDSTLQVFKPVDPTWEDTSYIDYFNKFDLNHLAFVVRGVSSELPYPAGSYKDQKMKKTINVTFGSKKVLPGKSSQLVINFLNGKLLSGLKQKQDVYIYNKGPEAIYDLNIKLSGDGKISFFDGKNKVKELNISVPELLPFKQFRTNFYLANQSFFQSKQIYLDLSYLDRNARVKLNFDPFFVRYKLLILILLGVICVFIFFFARKTRDLFPKK